MHLAFLPADDFGVVNRGVGRTRLAFHA
jgi:hypothetical protein